MNDHKITILVDLDGTLAHYDGWNEGKIGPPVSAMVTRVKDWLNLGYKVKIFTARVADAFLTPDNQDKRNECWRQHLAIQAWLLEHVGQFLHITAVKDQTVTELWDDRAVRVEKNTGVSELHEAHLLLSAAGVPEGTLPGRVQALVDRLVEAVVMVEGQSKRVRSLEYQIEDYDVQFKGLMGGRDL